MATIEQLGAITKQYNEIIKRVVNGSLDATAVRRGLQDIIEGKSLADWEVELLNCSDESPSWWRTPEQQLERARQLWPGVSLPEPPADFVPQTETEVLLLHVPDTFDGLWDKVVAPEGYTKYRWESVKSDKRHLRLAPNMTSRTTPVWLAFDYAANQGKAPDVLWGQSDLAASEILSALIQFPEWAASWNGTDSPYPNLAGYQLKYGTAWSRVPCLSRWDDGRRLELGVLWAADALGNWSSPVVREC